MGTVTNDFQAYIWLRLSKNNSLGNFYLDRLVLRMPTTQIREADKLVASFKPRAPSEAFAEFAFKRLKPLAIVGIGKDKSVFFYEGGFDEGEEKIIEFQGLPLNVKCVSIHKPSVVMEVMTHRKEMHLPPPSKKR